MQQTSLIQNNETWSMESMRSTSLKHLKNLKANFLDTEQRNLVHGVHEKHFLKAFEKFKVSHVIFLMTSSSAFLVLSVEIPNSMSKISTFLFSHRLEHGSKWLENWEESITCCFTIHTTIWDQLLKVCITVFCLPYMKTINTIASKIETETN